MKIRYILPLILLAFMALNGCGKKEDTLNCTISWQLYHQPKYMEENDIEQAFQEVFFSYYSKVNDNTVLARNTTRNDVRSLTLKLATMADSRITEPLDPANHEQIEVKVFINFENKYIEEIWSKTYL